MITGWHLGSLLEALHCEMNKKYRVPSFTLRRFIGAALLIFVPAQLPAQVQRTISTAKGTSSDIPVPHPLSWWTRDPLRLDASGDLMIGKPASDGKVVTARDYRINQKVTNLGMIAGLRVIQVLNSIEPGPRIISSGWASAGAPSIQWKSLLVQDRIAGRYIEIYELQAESGIYQPMKSAVIYGVGQGSILRTFDPDTGNGGGCAEGYWWFDSAGAHPVDFSPLMQAVTRVLPRNSTYTSRCWALHPEKAELQSPVQKSDAECHACANLGTIFAKYKIQGGAAIPITVHFEPDNQQ